MTTTARPTPGEAPKEAGWHRQIVQTADSTAEYAAECNRCRAVWEADRRNGAEE